MNRFAPFAFALPAILVGQTLAADVTPSQIWNDWRSYMEGMGYTVSADENASGDDLTLENVTMNVDGGDEAPAVTMSVGTLTMKQNSDGSVDIVMPETMPLTVVAEPNDEGEAINIKMDMVQSGHTMRASGSPEDIRYDYKADTASWIFTDLKVGGEGPAEGEMNVRFDGKDLVYFATNAIGDLRSYAGEGKIGEIAYDIQVSDTENGGQLKLNGTLSDLGMTGAGSIPLTLQDATDLAAMIKSGFDVSGGYTYGSSQGELYMNQPVGGEVTGNFSSGAGTLDVALGANGLVYKGGQENMAFSFTPAAMPFEISAKAANSSFLIKMPTTASEETQDMALMMNLTDLELSDVIWGMFDPQGKLPRDPATLNIDVSGKGKLAVEYLDPKVTETMGATPPGELEALSINDITLSAAGAKLNGSGEVLFDNAAAGVVPGMPQPVGDISFSLVGGNALLDNLIAMGILPEDQAMGFRMMMGLFTTPGDAPDTLTSKIEFTEDGQILANGQRLQ